jgi:hypothetical protein
MEKFASTLLAQGTGQPTYGHRDAYEAGQKVGEITFYVLMATVLAWCITKYGTTILREAGRFVVRLFRGW